MRDLVALSCEKCKHKNYTATKNKKLTPDKLQRRKYCPVCRTHAVHKEVKV